MKWYLITGTGIVVVIVLVMLSLTPKKAVVTNQTPGLPVASSTGNSASSSATQNSGATLSVPGRDGVAIATKDFINNGETVADVENPGSYVLAGSLGYCLADGSCPAGANETDFSVAYNDATGIFTIVLLVEPLDTSRTEAEQFLESRLGISVQQLCNLNYKVGTPYWVNQFYDDKNLGFSSCTGATQFPQ